MLNHLSWKFKDVKERRPGFRVVHTTALLAMSFSYALKMTMTYRTPD